jgi:hypothetical protein
MSFRVLIIIIFFKIFFYFLFFMDVVALADVHILGT